MNHRDWLAEWDIPYKDLCYWCGCDLTAQNTQQDHVWPDENTTRPSCAGCNHFKSDADPLDFVKELRKSAFRDMDVSLSKASMYLDELQEATVQATGYAAEDALWKSLLCEIRRVAARDQSRLRTILWTNRFVGSGPFLLEGHERRDALDAFDMNFGDSPPRPSDVPESWWIYWALCVFQRLRGEQFQFMFDALQRLKLRNRLSSDECAIRDEICCLTLDHYIEQRLVYYIRHPDRMLSLPESTGSQIAAMVQLRNKPLDFLEIFRCSQRSA